MRFIPKVQRLWEPLPVVDKRVSDLYKTLPDPSPQQLLDLQKDWNLAEVEEQFSMLRVYHRRQSKIARSVGKFSESFASLVQHTTGCSMAFFALVDKAWFYDLDTVWLGFPFYPMPLEIRYTYIYQLGYYLHQIVYQFVDHARSDFWEMFIHHVCTIILISLSYLSQCHRIGVMIMFLHDLGDIPLHVAKLANYSQYEKLCDIAFGTFAVLFFLTRLVWLPFWVAHAGILGYHEHLPDSDFPAHRVMSGCMIILIFLHCFWMFLLSKMIYRVFLVGKVEKDIRSGSDVDAIKETSSSSTAEQ